MEFVERFVEDRKNLPLLPPGVSLPAAREPRSQSPSRARIPSGERAHDHSGQLAELDVLEAELAKETLAFRLDGRRGERSLVRGEGVLLFEGGVAPQRIVESADRLYRGLAILRRQKAAEEIVQAPVIALEELRDERGIHLSQRKTAGERVSSARPSTGWRTSTSAAPTSKP